ncbi:hypothetical protein [Azorhizophilus paspali]|uniref:hypothetical protein n=1 Tax=Azorhizophilus paspali TaxID=69963 RepID=UPI003748F9C5
MIYNPLELHPVAGSAIVIRQNGNAITVTLDQLHHFTSDICILAARMREDLLDPLGDEK